MVPTFPRSVASGSDDESGRESSIGGSSIVSRESTSLLWRKFEGGLPIPGFLGNVVAVFRDSFDKEDVGLNDTRSTNYKTLWSDGSRTEQKNLAMEICRYLLCNQVERVGVSSNFAEHAKTIGGEFLEEKDRYGVEVMIDDYPTRRLTSPDSIDVSVILLMTCTGRLQQHKMFELVRDSYIASRLGVIILGTNDLLSGLMFHEDWKRFVTYLKNPTSGIQIRDKLEIYCRRHQSINRDIFNGQDLRTQSPTGGCKKFCGIMECGHHCPFVCHSIDQYHRSEEFRCKKPCERRCTVGHRCKGVCWMDCGHCMVVITVQNSCVHFPGREKQLFCYERNRLESCQIGVEKRLGCGHYLIAPCSTEVDEILCKEQISKKFDCGHHIEYMCWERSKYDNNISKCQKLCGKKLKCGHICPQLCHKTDDPNHENWLCGEPCRKFCKRGVHPCPRQWEHPCWEPCTEKCDEVFEYTMHCGHSINILCSEEDPDPGEYFCTQPCPRDHGICRHPCTKLCGEECGKCEAEEWKVALGCPVGHEYLYKCQDRPTMCMKKVPSKVKPDCGHRIMVRCHEAETITREELAEICSAPCTERLDQFEKQCGHLCRGSCADCFQGRFHIRCEEPCGKLLICGHSCTSPCGMACPPCRYPCLNFCEHSECKFECGVPCVRNCEEPCVYKCAHSACSKKCSETCNKQVCNEPCPEILPCGHHCVGFCGEICPPYCRICSPEKLLRGVLSSGGTELEPDFKFIYLPSCGHCVESNDFECWLAAESEQDEILAIRCPICTQRITWIRRYSQIFEGNAKLVNSVREKIFGDRGEIEKIVDEIEKKIVRHVEKVGGKPGLPDYEKYLKDELQLPRNMVPNLKEQFFLSMSLDKAKFLNWVTTEWINCSEILVDFSKKLPKVYYNQLEQYWIEYLFNMAANRDWPLHQNEVIALSRERERMEDLVTLYSRMDTTNSGGSSRPPPSYEAIRLFRETEKLLRERRPYTEEVKEEFRAALKDLDAILSYTLNITERERLQIVFAFGEGSGRWFKCVNGHVYVVTECGGATEMGTCNECGAPIGGQNHVLVEQNYLATEMDGAEEPLYPTVLQRNHR